MPIRRSRNRAKQPFQDITDQFTTLPDTLPTSSLNIPTPTPILRRRPRAPGGTLGAKLRAARNPIFPSSLPPSSPPSTSSRLPWGELEREDEGDENVAPLQILTSDNLAEDALDFEFNIRHTPDDMALRVEEAEDWVQDDPTPNPADMSDPFGFFAVERQLKVERAAKLATGAKPAARLGYHAEPLPAIDLAASNFPARNDPVDPSTPHKRINKRRPIASLGRPSDGFSDPNTSSMPSTPSPSKPISNTVKSNNVPVVDDSDSLMEPERSVPKTRASKRLRKKPKSPSSPARDPRAPLVKRPTRRTALGERPAARSREQDKKEVPEPKETRRTTRMTMARTKPAPSGKRGKKKDNEEADDLEAERRERWEQERQARIEYFRKLQDYQVEKENVYVI